MTTLQRLIHLALAAGAGFAACGLLVFAATTVGPVVAELPWTVQAAPALLVLGYLAVRMTGAGRASAGAGIAGVIETDDLGGGGGGPDPERPKNDLWLACVGIAMTLGIVLLGVSATWIAQSVSDKPWKWAFVVLLTGFATAFVTIGPARKRSGENRLMLVFGVAGGATGLASFV